MHMDDENPGYIADFLGRKSIPYRIIRAYAGDTVPEIDGSMRGLVFMGGVMSANDEIPWIGAELRLIEQALDRELPLLGHCLGGQLISKALGQEIRRNPVREVGWHDCFRAKNGVSSELSSQWLQGVEDPFVMFHWHNECFELPAGARHLFASEFCENQAYVYRDNVLAMQCHVEMTLPLVTRWITEWQEDLEVATASEQDFAQISENLERRVAELNRVADSLYGCWASRLGE